jgi:hypothetical protein
MDKLHCALGLSLLRLLARPSVWAGSAWAGSPLLEVGELRSMALGGGALSIPATRRREKAGKLTRSKLASWLAQFWGKKGGVLTGVGLSMASAVGRVSWTATALPAG